MGKSAGAMNYSLPEVMHMLDIVKHILPQGKVMWESVAARYNASKESQWSERELESLRRKFKSLYSVRKPTGDPNIPAHVRLAKDVKRMIDEASSVFIAIDEEDADADDADQGKCVSASTPGPRTPPAVGTATQTRQRLGGVGTASSVRSSRRLKAATSLSVKASNISEESSTEASQSTDVSYRMDNESDGYLSTGTLPFDMSQSDLEMAAFDNDRLEQELEEASKTLCGQSVAASAALTTNTSGTVKNKGSTKVSGKKPTASVQAKRVAAADGREQARYLKLSKSSDRLGGVDLTALRDVNYGGTKRTSSDLSAEASYTRQRQQRAEKAAADLKNDLAEVTHRASESASELVKTIIILRADAERADKAREEIAEARRREERREERELMEIRRREDKEEARAHMQSLMRMISAIHGGKTPQLPQ